MASDLLTELCRCPKTGESLRWTADGSLASSAGHTYPVEDGVAFFLPELSGAQAATKKFYDEFGWAADEGGEFQETKAFVDKRRVSSEHTRACMRRLMDRYFRGGKYFLDAGSGPLVDEEVTAAGARYERHICIDLSRRALYAAREKLGDRGLYLKCDLANLPIGDNSIDAVACNHVIYQLPTELQAPTVRELWRVLKPGGVAVLIYWWSDAKLPWRLERIAKLLPMRGPGEPNVAEPLPDLPHNIQSRAWFEEQDWPFEYSYDIYNSVPQLFMRTYIPDDWRGRGFLSAMRMMQTMAPNYCGKHGLMPAIVFRKSAR